MRVSVRRCHEKSTWEYYTKEEVGNDQEKTQSERRCHEKSTWEYYTKEEVGNDQEKTQSERNSNSKYRGGKKLD